MNINKQQIEQWLKDNDQQVNDLGFLYNTDSQIVDLLNLALKDLAPKSEWVSVDDALPGVGELVLVCWFDGDHYRYELDSIENDTWIFWFNSAEHLNIAGGNAPEDAPYTHWRKLEPPK